MAHPEPAVRVTERRPCGRRILARFGIGLAGLLVLLVVAVLVWSQVGVLAAEPEPLAAVHADESVAVTDEGGALVLSPVDGASGVGLVFVPGGKVEAEAYAARLAGAVSEGGLTVVISRPWLNLAFFDLRGLDSFTSLAPEVTTWMVGGHSLGGVRACSLADDADALVLLASYCALDVSDSGVSVLSISGSEDALTTPDDVAGAAHLLPADAELVEIEGANHAAFGHYGPQNGDGEANIDDEEMSRQVTELLVGLAEGLG